MKIRHGFVSNSSSSSFVVAFDKLPESMCELQQMLFGEETHIGYYEYSVPTSVAANVIWRDMFSSEDAHDLDTAEIIEEIDGGYLGEDEEQVSWPRVNIEDGREAYDKAWEEYRTKRLEIAKNKALRFIANNRNAHFRKVEYSDNDGELFSTLEHGGTFDRLPHVQISHH